MTTRMVHPISIIQGGSCGSEAKGAIAAYLAIRDGIDYAVRTGATNAGHTVYFKGQAIAMQQLPVAWVRPDTKLVIGAGALIDLAILHREVELINRLTGEDVRNRLHIDYRAYIHRGDHAERSRASGRHTAMGATGKGCSEALVDRIRLRGVEDWTIAGSGARDSIALRGYCVCDTEELLNREWDAGARIQLEGTQGQGLDLYLGPYPYTTHKQTGPAQWMLEAGLSPALPVDITMVIRTFPIRVAGNSGPLPNEMSWPELAREINAKRASAEMSDIVGDWAIEEFEEAVREAAKGDLPVPAGSDGLDQHRWDDKTRVAYRLALSELHKAALAKLHPTTVAELKKLFELTTVTKKLRRIARLHTGELESMARQIRPRQVAVTFMNYERPDRWGDTGEIDDQERGYLSRVEKACHAPVRLINRGPLPEQIVEIPEQEWLYRVTGTVQS